MTERIESVPEYWSNAQGFAVLILHRVDFKRKISLKSIRVATQINFCPFTGMEVFLWNKF